MLLVNQLIGFGAATSGLTTVSAHPTLTANLLSYWRLEETSGNRADEVGGLTLTDNNTVLQGTGKAGNCADFERTNNESLSTASNHVSTIGSGSYSAFAWINPESIASGQATHGNGIFANIAAEADGSFQLSVSTAGALIAYNHTGSMQRQVTNTTPCSSLATWYHVGMVYNTSTLTVYVNGASVATTGDASMGSAWGTGLYIGRHYADAAYVFDGLIDEVGMWSKALTTQEITDLYNGGAGLPYV